MNRPIGAIAISAALAREAAAAPGLVPFLTGGFPSLQQFFELLPVVAACADVLEIGVPFSDPMADGLSIQNSSRVALEAGTSLSLLLEGLAEAGDRVLCPVVFMSYYNPLLAYGLERLVVELEDHLPAHLTDARERALTAAALCVGGIGLARGVGDSPLAAEVLAACSERACDALTG